jgi:hypothetical protein
VAYAHRATNHLAPGRVANPGMSHHAMLELERAQALAAPMNVAKPTFDNLLDRPSSKSIRNSDALDCFVEARMKLFDLHFA